MSFWRGTRLGTVASLAGCHISVSSSSTTLAARRPGRLSTKGSVTSTRARPRSQATITRLRSSRSTITPTAVARKNPGATRLASTREMAGPSDPSLMRAASEMVAKRPSQSPMAETTWASQSRKKLRVPNTCSRRPAGRTAPKASSSRMPADVCAASSSTPRG